MKTVIKTALAGILLLPMQAQAGPFVGVGGSLMALDDGYDTVRPLNAFVRGGFALNRYFELGGELNYSLIADEIDGVDFEVDTTFLYLQVNAPIGDRASVYFMAGPTDIELTGTYRGVSIASDDSDTGFGVGLRFDSAADSAISFDYITYYNDGGVDVDALNLSFRASF